MTWCHDEAGTKWPAFCKYVEWKMYYFIQNSGKFIYWPINVSLDLNELNENAWWELNNVSESFVFNECAGEPVMYQFTLTYLVTKQIHVPLEVNDVWPRNQFRFGRMLDTWKCLSLSMTHWYHKHWHVLCKHCVPTFSHIQDKYVLV